MKTKTVFAASLLFAGAAFATATTVTTDYVLGVMPVATTDTYTIISIPWVDEGSNASAVAVTNLVKTAGLGENDELYWYDNSQGKYRKWVLREDPTSTVKYWDAVTSVGEAETIFVGASDTQLQRGQALMLKRAGVTSESKAYVIGQVGKTSSIETTITGPSLTLIAPPITVNSTGKSGIDLNSAATGWNDTCVGDVITVDVKDGFPITYTCQQVGADYKWGYVSGGIGRGSDQTFTSDDAVVPVGKGFWYKRRANTNLTITWNGVPSVQ